MTDRVSRGGRLPRENSRLRQYAVAWVLAAALFGLTGCSPGRTLARAMRRAPNTYPTWLAPSARVRLQLPSWVMTNLPSQKFDVGPPAARLWVAQLAPGDYDVRLSSTNRVRRGQSVLSFSLRARFPPQPRSGTGAVPRGTVILVHGYGVDSLSLIPWALTLAESGYQAVLVDLRGHGDSSGKRLYFGTVESTDLRQVLDELIEEEEVTGPFAVMGDSFGAAMALRWAAKDPRLSAAIALAPYAELEPAILGIRDEYASWLPRSCARAAAHSLPALLDVSPQALDTAPIMAQLDTPVLLVAAGHDCVAPPRGVGRMARLARGPVKYFTIPSARHESLPYHFEELREPILDWLDMYCRPDGEPARLAGRLSREGPAQPGAGLDGVGPSEER